MSESVYKICLWLARGWMVVNALVLVVAIYLLFLNTAALFENDSLTPASPLSSRLCVIGFICFLFSLGYIQHYLVYRKLNALNDSSH